MAPVDGGGGRLEHSRVCQICLCKYKSGAAPISRRIIKFGTPCVCVLCSASKQAKMMLAPRVLSRTSALATRKFAPALQLQPRVSRACLSTKAQQGGGSSNENVGIERRGGSQRPPQGMTWRGEEPLFSSWPSFRCVAVLGCAAVLQVHTSVARAGSGK